MKIPCTTLIATALSFLILAGEAEAREGFFPALTSAMSPAPGLDPAFSEEQKRMILRAISLIPACHRRKALTLRFVRSNAIDAPADECTEGYYPGNGSIILYPRCGFSVATVVHELFHHLGRFDGLNEIWKGRVLKKFPSCPVSDYAADGLGGNNEDLAETGRLLLVPESGDRNPGACVDSKIAELRRILGC